MVNATSGSGWIAGPKGMWMYVRNGKVFAVVHPCEWDRDRGRYRADVVVDGKCEVEPRHYMELSTAMQEAVQYLEYRGVLTPDGDDQA